MFDLKEIAIRAMEERGFAPEFSDDAMKEVQSLGGPAELDSSAKDLRGLNWISIDNHDSKDLDQLTFAEKGSGGVDRIWVAIADVDGLVWKNSAIDKHARLNTTSVYTPIAIFPMLPLKLSNDWTSLNESQERSSIVVELAVDREGVCETIGIYKAIVLNRAKLAYGGVNEWLEGKENSAIIEQVRLQDKIAQRIKERRLQEGALAFERMEWEAVLSDGLVVELRERKSNRAHELIENFMIAANVAATRFLSSHNMPVFRRILRTPKKWGRIIHLAKHRGFTLPEAPDAKSLQLFLNQQRRLQPDQFPELSLAVIKLLGRGEYAVGYPDEPIVGHFDLALKDYAHATAPNRRFPDLVIQRLLKTVLDNNHPPYSKHELHNLAKHCTEKETDANKVERLLSKCAAAQMMEKHIGQTFKAMVTGASEKGVWIRLNKPPVEGKLVYRTSGLDVGDWIDAKLIHVDVLNGFIDFERA